MDQLPPVKRRKRQIREPVEAALQLIVSRGLTIGDAAEAVGYQAESLAKAMRKQHVADRLSDIKRAWLSSRTFQAWVGMAELADSAVSEEVRHRSLKVFLEAAGELAAKSHAAPMPGVAVQIIVGTGSDRREVTITDAGCGVIESPPYMPPALVDAPDE